MRVWIAGPSFSFSIFTDANRANVGDFSRSLRVAEQSCARLSFGYLIGAMGLRSRQGRRMTEDVANVETIWISGRIERTVLLYTSWQTVRRLNWPRLEWTVST